MYAADASEPFSEAPQILNQVCSTPTFRIPNTAGTIGSTGWNPLHTLHTLVCKTRRGLTAATRAQLKGRKDKPSFRFSVLLWCSTNENIKTKQISAFGRVFTSRFSVLAVVIRIIHQHETNCV